VIGRAPIVALVAVAVTVALAVSLGNWQTRRGAAKEAMQASWDAAQRARPRQLVVSSLDAVVGQLPQQVAATGRFLEEATVFLDNRIVKGTAGVYVVTPLVIDAGAPWVLVNRGWMARAANDRARLPVAPAPDGVVTITGIAVERAPRLLDLGRAPERRLPGVWQNLDFDEYERVSGQRVARFVVQQINDTGDGLQRSWTAPAADVDKHRGYALQWYGLAALIVVLTIFYGGRALLSDRARRRR
jgi:surfeit locus 1 family protein